MIIGFGFGNPLQSIIMLLFTSLISYVIYRSLRNVGLRKQNPLLEREQRKQDYYAQRQRAREYARLSHCNHKLPSPGKARQKKERKEISTE